MMSKGARLAREAVRARAHPPEHDKALAELEAWASDVTAMLGDLREHALRPLIAAPEKIAYFHKPQVTEVTLDEVSDHDDGDAIVGPPVDVEEILRTLEEVRPFKHEPGAPDLPSVPESGDVPLPNGCRLYWETDKTLGIRTYSSDEIGGGVDVWNTALIDPNTLLTAIVTEAHLGRLEQERARRRGDADAQP